VVHRGSLKQQDRGRKKRSPAANRSAQDFSMQTPNSAAQRAAAFGEHSLSGCRLAGALS
jgi:hypothetical protein